MLINDRIKYLRTDILKLTQEKFAEKINLKRNSVALIESGRSTSNRTILEICRKFNVNEEWLRNGNGKILTEKSKEYIDLISDKYNLNQQSRFLLQKFLEFDEEKRDILISLVYEMVAPVKKAEVEEQLSEVIKLRVYEQKASAGLGKLLLDDVPFYQKEYIKNNITRKADHVVVIDGDSMSPTLNSGQEVFVREQSSLNNNDIGIFVYNDEVYCKRLSIDYDNQKIVLKSDNSDYNNIIIDDEDMLKTIGKVIL